MEKMEKSRGMLNKAKECILEMNEHTLFQDFTSLLETLQTKSMENLLNHTRDFVIMHEKLPTWEARVENLRKLMEKISEARSTLVGESVANWKSLQAVDEEKQKLVSRSTPVEEPAIDLKSPQNVDEEKQKSELASTSGCDVKRIMLLYQVVYSLGEYDQAMIGEHITDLIHEWENKEDTSRVNAGYEYLEEFARVHESNPPTKEGHANYFRLLSAILLLQAGTEVRDWLQEIKRLFVDLGHAELLDTAKEMIEKLEGSAIEFKDSLFTLFRNFYWGVLGETEREKKKSHLIYFAHHVIALGHREIREQIKAEHEILMKEAKQCFVEMGMEKGFDVMFDFNKEIFKDSPLHEANFYSNFRKFVIAHKKAKKKDEKLKNLENLVNMMQSKQESETAVLKKCKVEESIPDESDEWSHRIKEAKTLDEEAFERWMTSKESNSVRRSMEQKSCREKPSFLNQPQTMTHSELNEMYATLGRNTTRQPGEAAVIHQCAICLNDCSSDESSIFEIECNLLPRWHCHAECLSNEMQSQKLSVTRQNYKKAACIAKSCRGEGEMLTIQKIKKGGEKEKIWLSNV